MSKYGLILVLLLAKTLAQEDPEPIFKAVGETLDMFFCFGVDYIVVYRINEGEKLLLWNSSALVSPPDDYKNRIKSFNTHYELLGFQFTNLKLSDAGVYLRECWLEGNLTNQHTNYLYVCDEEIPSQELFLQNGGAVVDCDIGYSEHDNTSVKWFREVYPGYKTTLFLDTEKLQETLEEELKVVIQVQDKGFSLYISEAGLEQNQNFFCLVIKRGQCKHFKNIQLPESNKPEMQSVYFAVGEKAVLSCMSEHLNQQQKYWQTPDGEVSATTPLSQMFISKSEGNKDNSLVIPSITHNHSGEYTCLSQLVEAEYHITVCSELVSDNVHLYIGEKVILDCTLPKDEPVNILWYRQLYHMEIELLYDSEDPSINLPDDIMDRTHISDSNASLILMGFKEKDSGAYWCVVLLDSNIQDIDESLENDDEEDDDGIEDYTEEDNTETCIIKRVTQLKIQSKNPRRSNEDFSQNPQTEPESSPVPYAIIGGVFGILILGLVVLFVVKVKAKKRALHSRRAEHRTQKKDPAVSAPLVSL
ncbi:hypothetical protein Q7C36_009614 [Tachysurus vachellii]|uniref:Ig-like domain-containing protein n=1 Tax=Tachysurus vachellii TaxID=175792 RepID=A0AA88N0N4_TACVA|nr:hypothetical protein Q7C36_009614 [Tachysurus vachellii]